MAHSSLLPSLSFFKCDKYSYGREYVCDFSKTPRPHYCMGLVLEGSGVFSFDGKSVTVTPGDVIFVPVGSTYVSLWTGAPAVNYISAHFYFENNRLFPYDKKPELQRVRLMDTAGLTEAFLKMHRDFGSEDGMHFAAIGAFYEILSRVYPHLRTEAVKRDRRIERAVEYIELHYKEPLCVPALAALADMGESHFYASFKAATGESPISYKNGVAVRHAELLLLGDRRKSIEEISEEAGFQSAIYFREVFKKITGKTPTEYRRSPSPESGSACG